MIIQDSYVILDHWNKRKKLLLYVGIAPDVAAKSNLLVSHNDNILLSEILGSLKMKSFLSGMPELKV